MLRSVIDGKAAVIEARVGDRRCACIYDLHDGRIAGAIEYWVAPAADGPAAAPGDAPAAP